MGSKVVPVIPKTNISKLLFLCKGKGFVLFVLIPACGTGRQKEPKKSRLMKIA